MFALSLSYCDYGSQGTLLFAAFRRAATEYNPTEEARVLTAQVLLVVFVHKLAPAELEGEYFHPLR